jgi:hypothetical protein
MVYKQGRERVNHPRSLPAAVYQADSLAKYRCAKRYSAFTGAFGDASWLYFASSVPSSEALYM